MPREEVDLAVAVAFDRWDVAELACDPWGWRSEIEQWAKVHGEQRVLEEELAARPGHEIAGRIHQLGDSMAGCYWHDLAPLLLEWGVE